MCRCLLLHIKTNLFSESEMSGIQIKIYYIIIVYSSSVLALPFHPQQQDAIQSDAYHSLDKNSKYLLLPFLVQMIISDWFPTKLESLYHRNSQGMTEERLPVFPQNDKNCSDFSLDRSILDCTLRPSCCDTMQRVVAWEMYHLLGCREKWHSILYRDGGRGRGQSEIASNYGNGA